MRNFHDDCISIPNDHELDDIYVEVDKSSNTAYFKAPKLFDSKSIYSLTVIIIDHQTFLQNYSANIHYSDIYYKLRDRLDVFTISIVNPHNVKDDYREYIYRDPDDSNRIKISLNNGDHILRWIYGGETNTLPDGNYRLMYHTLTGTGGRDRGDYYNHINFTIGTPGPEDNTPLNPHRDEIRLYAYYQERINEKFRMMKEYNEPPLSYEEEKEKKQADFERENPAYVEFRNTQRHARGTSRLRIINEDIKHDNNVRVWIIRCRALPPTTEGTSIEIYVGAEKALPEDDKNPLQLRTQLKFATDRWNEPLEQITYRRIQTFPIHIYKGLYCNVRNFKNQIMVRLSYMNSEDPEILKSHNGPYTNEATCDPYVLMMPPKITEIEPIIYKSIDTRVGVFTGRCLCKQDVLTENGSDAYSITIDKGSSGSAAYFTLELNVISKDENGQQMNEMTIPIYNTSEFLNNNDPIHYSVADPSFVYPESQLGPQGPSWSEQRYFRARGIGNRQFSFQLIKRARHLPELATAEEHLANENYLHLTPIFNDEDIHHVEYSNLAEAPPFTPFTGNGDENTIFQGISYSPLPDTTNRTPPVYVPSKVDCNGNELDEDGNIVEDTVEDTVEVESAELETEELESEAMEDRRYYSTASNLKNYPLCEPISQDTCLAAENKPLYIDSETCNKYNEIDRYIELMKVQIGEAREIRKKGYDLLKSNNISYSFNNGTN